MIKSIINPDLFHGYNKKSNFFEGWYFKLSDASKKNVYAFIPGIFLGNKDYASHSFIQVLDGRNAHYYYKKHSKESFKSSTNKLQINIENNNFSLEKLQINIEDTNLKVNGQLYFNNVIKWPDSLINPGSMGYYNYLKFMQCYSQVCAIDMDLSGSLNINGEIINFNGGKGYIEKNWGKSFPYSWIWVQCNMFSNINASLSCSIGHIPFLFSSFRGFLIGFKYNDTFIKFTTLNKSNINIYKKKNDISIIVSNKEYELEIETCTKKESFILCNGPKDNNMVPLVEETLIADIYVKLVDKKTNSIILKDIGCCGGIEYGGDQMWILNKKLN